MLCRSRLRCAAVVVLLLGCGSEDSPADDESSTGDDSVTSTTDSSGDPSGDRTTLEDSSSLTMTGDETASGTDPTETTGPSDCQVSADCTDPNHPVCLDHECVPCTETFDGDMACNAKNEARPVCLGDGHCVQCARGNAAACGDTTPVCDEGTSTCVGCTYHEQCAATACDIATGACFDDGCVIDVEDGESIGTAVTNECVLIVHAGGFAERVQINGEKIALLGAEGDSPYVGGEAGNGQPSFDISGGAVVYIQGLRINGNDGSGLGIDVDGSTLYLDRTEVVENTGGGITLSNAANAQVRNSFVGGAIGIPALEVASGSSASVLYTTLGGSFSTSPALTCIAPGDVLVRNSILVARSGNPEVACAAASISYSATESTPGTGNVMLGVMGDPEAMDWFDDYDNGGFELANPPAAVLTAAQWRVADPVADPPRLADDPAVDIGGSDLRPTEDMAADVAGADVP